MKIIDLKHPDRDYPIVDCGLMLGNFDGVHRGHKALIDELKRLNKKRSPHLPLGAFCFTSHPSQYFGSPIPLLCDTEQKMELFRRAGLQFIVLCDFEEMKDMSPEEFVADVLIRDCKCRIAVCGFNYTFGKKAAGKAEDLANWLGTQPGREVSIVPSVTDGRHVVSSSVIRKMLEGGHPEDATRLLGRPYSLSGKVKKGKQVGRKLSAPTANLIFPPNRLVPAHGVYAVTVRVGRRTYFGICNVGKRPTFDDGNEITCETYLFDFNGDLYRKTIEVSFLHFLRSERAFASEAELSLQIQKDVEKAKAYFS